MINNRVDVLVISLGSPLLVGVYNDNKLIESFTENKKTSDILPVIFKKILKKYEIENLFFAKGPGSFMAIKITYIFLRTLCTTLNTPIFATDGFMFNKNSPIKAVGSRFFMKKNDNITVEILNDSSKVKSFELPDILDKTIFSADVEPLYVLPAV
jgi:hypothetical protein